ncbi:MAG TPA: cytochrome c3 family protein [Acidobacteriota bacterium]|nr:cytochrome c3 family protein [Acidobacteriota bacterium]
MKKKRHFSPLELKVSSRYVYPSGRKRWMALGLLVALAAVLWAVLDFLMLDAGFVSSGPLSSQHARLASDCSACHSFPNATPSAKCASCHESEHQAVASAAGESSGQAREELALYGYPAHYAYFSDDLERTGEAAQEHDCSHCHSEHRGRLASISQVDDRRCTSCHEFASFAEGHPDFLASLGGLGEVREEGGLKFPHAVHVNKVLPEERKLEGEAACLFCHRPEASGEGFQALSFELHCAEGCHLNKDSPLLPMARSGVSGSPAVLAPEDLRRADPTAPCLPALDAAAFRRIPPGDPRRIRLQVINHRDCWIEENLRILRRTQHTGLGVADVLAQRAPVEAAGTSGPFDGDLLRQRYRDAVEALSSRLLRVRQLDRASQAASGDGDDSQAPSRLPPELRRGGAAESRLRTVSQGLERPGALGPDSMLAAASHEAVGQLDELLLQTFNDLQRGGYLPQPAFPSGAAQAAEVIQSLTLPCRECHSVSSLGLAPVRADQKTLRRARFDHSAHLVQMQCAECHASLTSAQDDKGEMLHLPSIDTCRGCHNPEMSADDCVTCHYFHPYKDRRMPLLSAGKGGRP